MALRALGAFLALAARASAQIPGPNEMRAHFIEVGQADATVLEFSCGVIMIDAGFQRAVDRDRLMAYVDTIFVRRGDARTIETLFITHNHADHTKAVAAIVGAYNVKHIITGGIEPVAHVKLANGQTSVEPRQIHATDVHSAQGLTDKEIDPVDCAGTDPHIAILSGSRNNENDRKKSWGSSAFNNENNHSLVIRVSFGSASFLFTGDMEEKALSDLVTHWDSTNKAMLDVDVYHGGHHGAKNATTTQLMDAVTPTLAVISMGRCDRNANGTISSGTSAWGYGHPTDSAVHVMEHAVKLSRPPATVWVSNEGKAKQDFVQTAVTAAVYATGWDGHVVVNATSSGAYDVTLLPTSVPPSCTTKEH